MLEFVNLYETRVCFVEWLARRVKFSNPSAGAITDYI